MYPYVSTVPDPSSFDILCVGTGVSSGVPILPCLLGGTQQPSGLLTQCDTCLSTLKPEGIKNKRNNVSTIVRHKGTTILIDCGKTFYNSCIEVLPQNGVRRIDGVLLTHEHADACNGIDDLRHWTLRSSIQDKMDIYLDQNTFNRLDKAFPFLTEKNYSPTGNPVANLHFHIIDGRTPFKIGEIDITPFYVEHGSSGGKPYPCLGFLFPKKLLYISDVSFIPQSTWDLLNGNDKAKIAILDCMHIESNKSHFGICDMLDAAYKYGADITATVGMGHECQHDDLRQIFRQVEQGDRTKLGDIFGEKSYIGLKVRPTWDGCKFSVTDNGLVVFDPDFD